MSCKECNNCCCNPSKDNYETIQEFKHNDYNEFEIGEFFKISSNIFKVVFNKWSSCNYCDNKNERYFKCTDVECHYKNFILYDTLDSDTEDKGE